jgi:predicted P-loop ATPase
LIVAKVVNLPVPVAQTTDEHARAETQRNQQLFAWADGVLKLLLGLDKAVAAAKTIEKLRSITLDVETPEVLLAIRDALHPVSGNRAEHFRGLREGGLKQILKNRFVELKKPREAKLRHGKQRNWTDQLLLDKEGKIRPVLANLILILREAPDWKGALTYDEFNARVAIKSRSPLENVAPGTFWIDHHESQARAWFQRNGVYPTVGDVGRAVQAAARYNPTHPVREYFASLNWDGRPRLETWLQTHLHVEDSPYVRAIGPRYLISGVARVFRPGCKVDHVLILEGPQGKLKSTLLQVLAIRDEWFSDRLSNIGSKDAAIETGGVLLIEIAEMEALIQATSSTSKGFLSRRYDPIRPPWGKHVAKFPRQCIFACTINPPVTGGYLKDPTGARRYWPVVCIGMIDIDGVRAVRDQLWAEAVHLYKADTPWWLSPELEALAAVEQAKRFVVDAWQERIHQWLGDRTDVSLWEVLEQALGLASEKCTQAAQKRVVNVLTHMGFAQSRPRTPEGKREYRYRRDPPPKKDV